MAPIFRRPVNNLPAELHFPRGEEEVMNKTLAWLTAKNQGGRIAGVNRKVDPMVFKFTAGDNIYDAIDQRIAQLSKGVTAPVEVASTSQPSVSAFATPRSSIEIDPIFRKDDKKADPYSLYSLDKQQLIRTHNPLPSDFLDNYSKYKGQLPGVIGRRAEVFDINKEWGDDQKEIIESFAGGKQIPDLYRVRHIEHPDADSLESFFADRAGRDSVFDWFKEFDIDLQPVGETEVYLRRNADGVDKALAELRAKVPFIRGGWNI